MLRASFFPYQLRFKRPAGTSRGVLKTKESWFIIVQQEADMSVRGIGECSLIPGLSPDDRDSFDPELQRLCENINDYENWIETRGALYPAIRFGLETALEDLFSGGQRVFEQNQFTCGNNGIAINGLIWMGEPDFMQQQIREKLDAGFDCIKVKIGAIDFEQELELLGMIRREYGPDIIEIRVDANGAFLPSNALEKLKRLSSFSLHSIEQPIMPGQAEIMAELCEKSPVPIALDEELIGVNDPVSRRKLLNAIAPPYVIFKPSLLGGLNATAAWAMLADTLNIKWWVTSALESNIGLNAIAQWTYKYAGSVHQGLGTGQLYTNNIPSPLIIERGQLFYKPVLGWDLNALQND
ncbi:MAG: o-succinylbenzoate synthase [Bacteroidales bacterium]|nr:o-succinylbenzoate synthase [Bacteroidales bacterium]